VAPSLLEYAWEAMWLPAVGQWSMRGVRPLPGLTSLTSTFSIPVSFCAASF
jgi:hypothetical protein